MKRVILVFLKFPESGRVKTRLAADLGEESAKAAYEKLVCRVLEQCRDAGPDRIVIAYDPPEKSGEIQHWLSPWLIAYPGEVSWHEQSRGDLGDRLEHAAESVFQECGEETQLAIIGTDCVHLDRDVFTETWSRLDEGADAVFGPTEDGGYYLLGLKAPQGCLFQQIPWSSEKTLDASVEAAEKAGLSTQLLPKQFDVDTIDEWRRVEAQVSGRRCFFFDRDGVVNRSPGPGYVLHEDNFHLNPGIAECLRWLKERDWLVILVTSQKGVGKGLMSAQDLERIHRKMQRELGETAFDGIFAFTGEPECPHLPKPDPEMIETACERFFIDPRLSWMIGDADRDIEMGHQAQLAGTIRVRGEKAIRIEADHTLDSTTEITSLFERIL